jgi:hypothetical protein
MESESPNPHSPAHHALDMLNFDLFSLYSDIQAFPTILLQCEDINIFILSVPSWVNYIWIKFVALLEVVLL